MGDGKEGGLTSHCEVFGFHAGEKDRCWKILRRNDMILYTVQKDHCGGWTETRPEGAEGRSRETR
jgi:hypothetical protein